MQAKKRILIADDSVVVLRALEVQLQAAGYDTRTATDGSEAVEKAGQWNPDLLIVDVNFPPDISQGGIDWDGFRVIEWMQHTGVSGLAPALIITSDEVEQHHARAIEVGAAAIFQKPVDIPELLATIGELLGQKSNAV